MSVLAVSNPLFTGKKPAKLYDRAAGYGIVRLNKKNRTIAMECWPRQADPSKGPDQQYEGWPIIVKQEDQYLKKDPLFLPEMHITGLDLPVIEVYSQEENEMIYSLRINKKQYRPKVNDKSKTYKIRVGDPDKDLWKIEENVTLESKELIFEF
jgi:hypothetical protein